MRCPNSCATVARRRALDPLAWYVPIWINPSGNPHDVPPSMISKRTAIAAFHVAGTELSKAARTRSAGDGAGRGGGGGDAGVAGAAARAVTTCGAGGTVVAGALGGGGRLAAWSPCRACSWSAALAATRPPACRAIVHTARRTTLAPVLGGRCMA